MDLLIVTIFCLSFSFSFFFALGGIGSAAAIIPVLTWVGVPFNIARPTGLFINTLSMSGATYSNIKGKRLDFKLGLPVIGTSLIMAPIGAWSGHFFPTRYILIALILFLVFASCMLLFFKGVKHTTEYREDHPFIGPALVGVLAGFFSGLLGVGGGGLISPLLILQGVNPKKIAAITAFAVPFSSAAGFATYALMGAVAWKIWVVAGLAACCGGYLGTIVMHNKMQPAVVKKFLGVILLLVAVRLFFTMVINSL